MSESVVSLWILQDALIISTGTAGQEVVRDLFQEQPSFPSFLLCAKAATGPHVKLFTK